MKQYVLMLVMAASLAMPAADARGSLSLDDQELIEYLLRSASGSGQVNLSQRISRRMELSSQRIGDEFEIGRDTQRLQQRIIDDLEEAIAQLNNQQSKSSEQGSGQQEKSQQPKGGAQQRSAETSSTATPGNTGGGATPTATASSSDAAPIEEGRREWGHLPPRDRDRVIQGRQQPYIEKFRDLIERYYRALAGPQKQ